jgi:hypothetical protein
MPKWVRAIIILLSCMTVITVLLIVLGVNIKNVESYAQLPLLAIIGVIALIIVLSCVAIGFSSVDLADKTQALGLPNGSMRAVIAMSLILIFAIVTVFLYGTLTRIDPNSGQPIEVPAAAQDFGKQLLVMLGTLITSVASFYFGTQSVAGNQKGSTDDPTLTQVDPLTLAQGASSALTATGTNLQLANVLKLSNGTTEIPATGVTSDASTVKGTITIPATATPGAWDVVAQTTDGKTGKLTAGFQVSAPTKGANPEGAGDTADPT